VDGEDVAVGLFVLGDDVALAGVGAEATRIGREHVDARLALDDPFRELPARPTCRRDAEAVPFVQPDVRQVPGRPDQRGPVRRVRDRPVDDVLDAAVGERGHATLRALDVRYEPLEVAVEEALPEPGRHAVGEARGGAGLVRPEDPAHALFTDVIRLVGLAHDGELASAALAVGLQLARLLINDVLVLDRDRRHGEAEHLAGLARVVAGRTDDVLAGDLALRGRQLPLARGRSRDGRHFGLLVDLRAFRPRAFAERHREVRRRDVAVLRMVERGNDFGRVVAAAELEERPELLHLGRTDDLEGHADRVRRATVLLILVEAVARGREPQVPGRVEADVLPGLGLEALVEVDRVLVELADRVAHVEERQSPRHARSSRPSARSARRGRHRTSPCGPGGRAC
jgi:hypothetical protein